MNKAWLAPSVVAVALLACGTATPVVQTVEVTRVVAPTAAPTRRPTPTQARFDPGRNWTYTPQFNDECNYDCEAWVFYDEELLLQVYPDGLSFGLMMVGTGDAYEEGSAIRQAAVQFGVPANLVSQAGDDIANSNFRVVDAGEWGYEVALQDDLLIVSFLHDGPINSRLG